MTAVVVRGEGCRCGWRVGRADAGEVHAAATAVGIAIVRRAGRAVVHRWAVAVGIDEIGLDGCM